MEQQTVEKYMQGNEIHLDQLPVIEPYVRKMLLSWVGKAMLRKDHTFQTEHGRLVKVMLDKEERVVLRATDGELEMPKIIFKLDRKSTRLNSSHVAISYAVFCLKK